MSQILEQLEINQTFFIQFILFGVFFFVLSELYLKPFQRLIEKRQQKLTDDLQGSAELLKTVESKLADYEKSLASARLEAAKQYDLALAEVRAREEAEISKVKDQVKQEYLEASKALQAERSRVEAELKAQVEALSDSMVNKVLAGN
jgi:F-type H+-transporting ATPase subunit b